MERTECNCLIAGAAVAPCNQSTCFHFNTGGNKKCVNCNDTGFQGEIQEPYKRYITIYLDRPRAEIRRLYELYFGEPSKGDDLVEWLSGILSAELDSIAEDSSEVQQKGKEG